MKGENDIKEITKSFAATTNDVKLLENLIKKNPTIQSSRQVLGYIWHVVADTIRSSAREKGVEIANYRWDGWGTLIEENRRRKKSNTDKIISHLINSEDFNVVIQSLHVFGLEKVQVSFATRLCLLFACSNNAPAPESMKSADPLKRLEDLLLLAKTALGEMEDLVEEMRRKERENGQSSET